MRGNKVNWEGTGMWALSEYGKVGPFWEKKKNLEWMVLDTKKQRHED